MLMRDQQYNRTNRASIYEIDVLGFYHTLVIGINLGEIENPRFFLIIRLSNTITLN